MASGDSIIIEERAHHELTQIAGVQIAADGIDVWNPQFDVTPGALITGIVTERGVISPSADGTFDVAGFVAVIHAISLGTPSNDLHAAISMQRCLFWRSCWPNPLCRRLLIVVGIKLRIHDIMNLNLGRTLAPTRLLAQLGTAYTCTRLSNGLEFGG
jgi:hypothetical protein